jgi:hypothetical protein
MSVSRDFRCSFAVRSAVACAALSAWLMLPAAVAQSGSSSTDQETASITQNQYSNQNSNQGGASPAAQYSSSAAYQQTYQEEIASLAQDQYPNQGGYSRQGYHYHENSTFSHIAIEAGGGFNRPLGFTRSFETWGGNVQIGAGWNFTRWFSTLAEWQLMDNKIPGAYLANVGVPGGHIHTFGLTLEPTVNIQGKGSLGAYAFGGGGFYRRVTTFTVPEIEEECYYFCYEEEVNVPVAHYSSNQGGFNLGGGVTWKVFGSDSNARLFAEGRFVWVNSPATNVFGTPDGTEKFLPISFGIRF